MAQMALEQMPNISAGDLANLQHQLQVRRDWLQQQIAVFEKRYQGDLAWLEQQLAAQTMVEHPAWEDSIEWRNALEQLEQIDLTASIFAWLQTLLTQSASS